MRTSRTFLLSLFLLPLLAMGQKEAVNQWLSMKGMEAASYSYYAVEASTGKVISHSPQKSLSTASVMKLLTTSMALDRLGPDYTFQTSLEYNGEKEPATGTLKGNLIIRGGFDPAFLSEYFKEHYAACFDQWTEALKQQGIQHIQGDLLLDLPPVDGESVPDGWCWDDLGNYYGAGLSPLSCMDNQFEIHFSSPAGAGQPTTVLQIQPNIPGLTLTNHVKSSLTKGDHTLVFNAPGNLSPTLEGTIPTAQTDFVIRASQPDPPRLVATLFLEHIRKAGLTLTGSIRRMKPDEQLSRSTVAKQVSPPLSEILVPLNKESLNLFAEHLLAEVARKETGVASLKAGIREMRAYVKEAGIDTTGFYPTDGSGLSRSNALTAKTLTEVLLHQYRGPNRELYFRSMPLAGVDGTLKNAFKGTPLEKNVTAKTGSMERVRSLAGKITNREGKVILFAILLNNFDLKGAEAGKILEKILMDFYQTKR